MFNTQPEPTSAITGAVVLAYDEATKYGCEMLLDFLEKQYGYHSHIEINTTVCDVDGYYLSEELWHPDNIQQVEEVLWVLEDVMGNTPLEEFCTQSTQVFINDITTVTLHEAYYSHNNVTLRVFIIGEEVI